MCITKTICAAAMVLNILFTPLALGSDETIGPNGIDALNLGLTGNGISIGQVESARSVDPDKDTLGVNSNIDPKGVFLLAAEANANMNADGHATEVAGVMISTDAAQMARGVASAADLYSGAIGLFGGEQESMTTFNHIAMQAADDVRAINASYVTPVPWEPMRMVIRNCHFLSIGRPANTKRSMLLRVVRLGSHGSHPVITSTG